MEEKPEHMDLPRSYKDTGEFNKLLLLRALRPDRLISALSTFVSNVMGNQYIDQEPFKMEDTYKETLNKTPIFFVLFPGVDPTPDVEKIARDLDITVENGKFVNISMGQGQEPIA